MFKSCNIYLKPERFRKSKFTLSKVKSEIGKIKKVKSFHIIFRENQMTNFSKNI